jgi:hypothetical protein
MAGAPLQSLETGSQSTCRHFWLTQAKGQRRAPATLLMAPTYAHPGTPSLSPMNSTPVDLSARRTSPFLIRLAQPHPWATAVRVDELHAGGFQGPADRQVGGPSLMSQADGAAANDIYFRFTASINETALPRRACCRPSVNLRKRFSSAVTNWHSISTARARYKQS